MASKPIAPRPDLDAIERNRRHLVCHCCDDIERISAYARSLEARVATMREVLERYVDADEGINDELTADAKAALSPAAPQEGKPNG